MTLIADRGEYITHAVKGLVDDSIMVAIERRLRFFVSCSANVFAAQSLLGLFDQHSSKVFGVARILGRDVQLVRPGSQVKLDRQPKRKIEAPERAFAFRDSICQILVHVVALRRAHEFLEGGKRNQLKRGFPIRRAE